MRYRRLGRSELMVGEVGVGAAALAASHAEGAGAIHAALDAGVNLVEVAIADARQLAVVADAIEGAHQRLVLIGTGTAAEAPVEAALEQLGADRFDCYLLDESAGEIAAVEAMAVRGLTRAVGLATDQPQAALAAIDGGGVDVVQLPFNLLAPDIEAVLRAAAASGVGVIGCSPLAGGRLATDADTALAEALAFLLHGEPRTLPQAAIAWALSEPRLAAVIAGPRSAVQATEDAEASMVAPLPEADRQRAVEAALTLD